MLYVILALAITIIVVLSVVAWHYVSKVKVMESNQKEAIAELEEKIKKQKEHRHKSIRIIAQGVLDEQLSFTEAAIRISGLMGSLEGIHSHREEFSAFFILAEATSHIPVLEQWKALPTKKKLVFDRERMKLEKDHKEFIIDASERVLKDPRFNTEGSLFYPAS